MIEHCGLVRVQQPSAGSPASATPRLVFLGDDPEGHPLEVMAVALDTGALLVIHAMSLRKKYRAAYEEAKKWQR